MAAVAVGRSRGTPASTASPHQCVLAHGWKFKRREESGWAGLVLARRIAHRCVGTMPHFLSGPRNRLMQKMAHGANDARWAASATMSSAVNFATVGRIRALRLPARVPALKSWSCRTT